MDRHYYIFNDAPWNDDLNNWWLAVEAVDKIHMVKLHGAGVLEDLPVTENDPTPDMNVLVGPGYAWDGYGAIIHPQVVTAVDCSVDKESVSTIPSSGKERIIVIAGKHDRKLSELAESLTGWPDPESGQVYTKDSDWYEFAVISGEEADPGNAVAPACAVDEIHLAQVTLESTTTQITDAMIDTSNRPVILNPSDAIALHVAADPAHAADKISYDDTDTQRGFTRAQTALKHLQAVYTDVGAPNALAINPNPAITAYAFGQCYRVLVADENTGGACTLNVSGKGATPIKTIDGFDPPAGVLTAGAVVDLTFDGTNFQIAGRTPTVQGPATAQTVLALGVSTTWTAIALSGAVPEGATRVFLNIIFEVNGGTRLPLLHLRPESSHAEMFLSASEGGAIAYCNCGMMVEMSMSPTRTIDYYVSWVNPNQGAITIKVVGYM